MLFIYERIGRKYYVVDLEDYSCEAVTKADLARSYELNLEVQGVSSKGIDSHYYEHRALRGVTNVNKLKEHFPKVYEAQRKNNFISEADEDFYAALTVKAELEIGKPYALYDRTKDGNILIADGRYKRFIGLTEEELKANLDTGVTINGCVVVNGVVNLDFDWLNTLYVKGLYLGQDAIKNMLKPYEIRFEEAADKIVNTMPTPWCLKWVTHPFALPVEWLVKLPNLKYIDRASFKSFYNLDNLALFNMSQVVSLYEAFKHYSGDNLKGIATWDVGNCRDFKHMFMYCENVINIPVEHWNMLNARTLSAMFSHCRNITELDLSNWNVSNVENMSDLFFDTPKLISLNVANWNVSNVVNMSGLFSCCSAEVLDVSNWDVSNVTHMSSMFNDCIVKALNINGWNVSKVKNMSGLFSSCEELEYLDISAWNTCSLEDISNIFANNYFEELNVNNLNVGKVTDFSQAFMRSRRIQQLDLSNWDMSSAVKIDGMFSNSAAFQELNISTWNTQNVESMRALFSACSSLTHLDIDNWNTANVVSMSGLFHMCTHLAELNISNWNVSKVADMSQMFAHCRALRTLDLSKWNVSNVIDMREMFYDCANLAELDIRGWVIARDTQISDIFKGTNLKKVYINKKFAAIYKMKAKRLEPYFVIVDEEEA